MKKILKAIALITCLIFPLSAMALTAIDDNDLSTVTGQSGVSINMDVRMDVSIDTIAWGDADGSTYAANIGGGTDTTNAGWVGLTGVDVRGVRARLREDLINTAWGNGLGATYVAYGEAFKSANTLFVYHSKNLAAAVANYAAAHPTWVPTGDGVQPFNAGNPGTWGSSDVTALGPTCSALVTTWTSAYATAAATPSGINYFTFKSSYPTVGWASDAIAPMTIDVATGTVGSFHGDTTFVRIGLGSLQISIGSLDATAKVSNVKGLDNTVETNNPINGLDNTLGSIYLATLEMYVNGASFVDIYNNRGTGTQGVTLYLGVKIDKITIDTLAWGDKDTALKLATVKEGWIGLKDTTMTNVWLTGAVTIDVATASATNRTYVNIGFAGLNVNMSTLDANVALGDAKGNLDEQLGSIYMAGLNATFTSGSVQIYAHSGSQGVEMTLNNLAITLANLTVSWGDSDGLDDGTVTSGGYVGMKTLAMTGLVLNGPVSIDVATVDADYVPTGTRTLMYAAYNTHNLSNSFVHIGLGTGDADFGATLTGTGGGTGSSFVNGTFQVTLGTLNADLSLGSNKTLNNVDASTLGSIYMSNAKIGVNGWVDIAAH